jgi:hypothetical protein
MLANQPPHLVCIVRVPAAAGRSRLPFPSPRREAQEELNTYFKVPRFQSFKVEDQNHLVLTLKR